MSELAPAYRDACSDIGLDGKNDLIYRPSAGGDEETVLAGLLERRDADISAGRTTWGAHHDELRLELDGRQLRRFGSQGQQRLGLLSLMTAERLALVSSGRPVPLLLLDDVMSELDESRRERLIEILGRGGQALITAAEESLIPVGAPVEMIPVRELVAAAEGEAKGSDGGVGPTS